MTVPYLTPLTATDLRPLGISAPWDYGLAGKVRFGEIDVLGHVNNAACLRWFEDFRISWMQALELTAFAPGEPYGVLRQITVDYLKEIKLGDSYVVTGRGRDCRTSSFSMDYGVHVLKDGGADLRFTGSAVMVMLAPQGGKSPLSAQQKAAIEGRPAAPARAPLPSFLQPR